MKKDWAMLLGWLAGVFTAGTVVIVLIFVESRGRGAQVDVLPYILMSVVLGAGPGLLLLSWWISARLKGRHAKGASRGSTLALGALVGATAGLPCVLLGPLIFLGPGILPTLADLRSPEALITIALGVVSGTACGFTCAWRVSRPS
ncbi:MAG TPA: hypothetical protein VF950_03625 [Planctomycetota bacterium]